MCYKLVDEKSVFANNELSLRDIAVYGFDYDYTLAHYTDELNSLIYQMSLEKLIKEYSVSKRLAFEKDRRLGGDEDTSPRGGGGGVFEGSKASSRTDFEI
jgi:hypothetical protein